MAGIKVMSKLKDGDKITGRVDSVSSTCVVLEYENESKVKLPLPETVLDSLNDEFDGEIVTITRTGDDYDIEQLEDWPDEKAKK